jgi:signal transduction histidine kinase
MRRFWMRRPDPVKLDWALAAVLTLAGELQVAAGGIAGTERLGPGLLSAALGLAVAFRRRYPTLAGTGAGVAMGLSLAFRGDPQVISNAIAYLCALYGLAVWSPPRRFTLGMTVILIVDVVPGAPSGQGPIWALGTLVVMLIVRRVVREREARIHLAERERDLAAHQAVLEERARIARELHDVIAHTVTVMVVQAQAGPDVAGDTARARHAFASIESSGREALSELRRLLGVLRTGEEKVAVAPQPGLGSLERLVAELRAAGRQVALHVEGTPVELPPGVNLSAYRIVQEALTNIVKHAPGARADVTVRYRSRAVEVEIVDDGPGASVVRAGLGHGLVGMRERAALYGGLLEAGNRNGRGYVVRAQLPVDPDAVR